MPHRSMILSQKDIDQLTRSGVKLTTSNGQQLSVRTPRKQESELDYLKTIAALLERLLAKPDIKFPKMEMKPPDVIVKSPDVIVEPTVIPPSPPRIRKWHFALKKDMQGHTEEIVATAIE